MKNVVKGSLAIAILSSVLAVSSAFATQPKDLAPRPTSELGAHVPLTPQVPSDIHAQAPLPPLPLPVGMLVAPAKTIQVTLAHGIDRKDLESGIRSGMPVMLNVTNAADILPAALAAGAQCHITAEGGGFTKANRPEFGTRSLSCFDSTGRLVADGGLYGYLLGSDNVLGLRSPDDVRTGTKATVVVNSPSTVHVMQP